MYLKPLEREELQEGYEGAFSWVMQYLLAIDEQVGEIAAQDESNLSKDEKRWHAFRTMSLAVQLGNLEPLLEMFAKDVNDEHVKRYIQDTIKRCKYARELVVSNNNKKNTALN